jgi:hypothetical protein
MKRLLTYGALALAVPPSALLFARMIYHVRHGNFALALLYGVGIAIWALDAVSYLGIV